MLVGSREHTHGLDLEPVFLIENDVVPDHPFNRQPRLKLVEHGALGFYPRVLTNRKRSIEISGEFKVGLSVAIITTDSNNGVSQLHERMPVVLDQDGEKRWLENDDKEELAELLDPFPASGL